MELLRPAEVYRRMEPRDRGRVAAPCFQAGRFTDDGHLYCDDWARNLGRSHPYAASPTTPPELRPARDPRSGIQLEPFRYHCAQEFACDVLAALICIPEGAASWEPDLPDRTLARRFGVEPWVVRFRRVLFEEAA